MSSAFWSSEDGIELRGCVDMQEGMAFSFPIDICEGDQLCGVVDLWWSDQWDMFIGPDIK